MCYKNEKNTALSTARHKKLFGGISANTLRLLAIVLMLADHIWVNFSFLGYWLTCIGRLAFPIFAFQIAEGFVHTSNIKKYILRLLVFAIVTEVPFNLFCNGWFFFPYHQNVLFTLLLGLLAIFVIDRARGSVDEKIKWQAFLWLFLIGLVSAVGYTDYGVFGVLTVVMFYITKGKGYSHLLQLAGLVIINFLLYNSDTIAVELFDFSFDLPVQGFAVLALIPIWLYNGKKGSSSRLMQYGFYVFYPAHMLVLYLIKRFA